MEALQSERVADDGNGTHGHGRGGDHGVQEDSPEGIEDPGSNGNTQDIIDESPEEVLSDRADGSPT